MTRDLLISERKGRKLSIFGNKGLHTWPKRISFFKFIA
jgi:hypothetical protein